MSAASDPLLMQGDLDRVLVSSTELTLGEKHAIVSLCDDGQVSEVAVEYRGAGIRLVYRGEVMILAAQAFDTAIATLVREGFRGPTEQRDTFDLAVVLAAHRALAAGNEQDSAP